MGREEWLLAENIEEELVSAQKALEQLDDLERSGGSSLFDDPNDDRHDLATHVLVYYVGRALRSIGALAERLGIQSIEREVSAARKVPTKLAATTRPFEGEIHSEALSLAYACFSPLRAMTNTKAVTAQGILKNILNNTAVILNGMGKIPKNEADVRNTVLEVCRYSFPDAMKEVAIPKIIKHYKGDLGIPSLRTMVEFKYIKTEQEMKSALDGIYADMKGYKHPDWNTFYSVFYMTGPFYIQEDIQREFELVRADLSWTPIVVNGSANQI